MAHRQNSRLDMYEIVHILFKMQGLVCLNKIYLKIVRQTFIHTMTATIETIVYYY